MALSDLAVYSEYAYSAMTEVLRQQIELFNQNSEQAILLRPTAHQGDYSDLAFFANMGGVVRRRNAYGSGSIAQKALQHLVDTMVKVAAGTPEIRLDPGQFRWIQQNPEVAGAAFGQQLAKEVFADMLNVALGCIYAALSQDSDVIYDATGETDPNISFVNMNRAARKRGDASNEIGVWVMHSAPMHDLYEKNLTNNERLFTFGTVNVQRDPKGKLLLMTDSPSLFTVDTVPDPDVTTFHVLGLTPGAAMIGQNNDFDAMEDGSTGDENLIRTYQAEWSYNVGIKGFTYDKATGGPSPTNAALFSSGNWDRTATSEKDLAGVVLEVLAVE